MASRSIVQTALTHVVRSVFASLFDKNILQRMILEPFVSWLNAFYRVLIA